MRIDKKGLTLIEVMMTLVLLAVMMAAATYVFIAIYTSWLGQETRAGIDINIDRALEETVRRLREAQEINCPAGSNEVRFTPDGHTYYIYYLYNEDDSYPPDFDKDSYELREAPLAGGMHGAFSYGAGAIVLTDVLPPPASQFLADDESRAIVIDICVKRDGETIRSKTKVLPRNL